MKTKVVNLKNNLKAKLTFEQMDDYYSIYAKDNSNKTVGCCNLSIVMNFARGLTECQREAYAKTHKLKIEETPTHAFAKLSPKKVNEHTKVGDKIKIGNNLYSHINSYCTLDKIEVTDSTYHKVGLGSAMLQFAIEFAEQNNCDKIEAFVYPNGQFKFSTLEFYKNNGFVFNKNNYATKQLSNAKISTISTSTI